MRRFHLPICPFMEWRGRHSLLVKACIINCPNVWAGMEACPYISSAFIYSLSFSLALF